MVGTLHLKELPGLDSTSAGQLTGLGALPISRPNKMAPLSGFATSSPPSSSPSSTFDHPLTYSRTASFSGNHKSNVSVATTHSTSSQATERRTSSIATRASHQEYLDSLQCPTREMVERISKVQEHKEEEVLKRHLKKEKPDLSEDEMTRAAGLIQRNYRGHRERRMLAGMSLDPSSRWVEAVKEAQYRNMVQPRAREEIEQEREGQGGELQAVDTRPGEGHRRKNSARQNWMKIGKIARRAGGDEDSDSDEWVDETGMTESERDANKRLRFEQKLERQKKAKIMDLQYFLEMVDLKHRYGSNLRTYHEEWKKSDTKENFFYWLDKGEGRLIDIQACPRERLDKEQVRYLSKEERLDYLVKINKDGRLCWAKNGALIDTTAKFKDSIHGIVEDTDDTPAFTPAHAEASHHDHHESHHHNGEHDRESSESSRSSTDDATARASKYANPELDNAKGVKKVKHVSAATIFNKLLRGSVKKNTWIFVADTSFRLYVGIKQSGAFQHSSFLHGSRISAAGLIKIKNGRLSKLSPLSGHYRPPVSNFRAFVHSLKDAGADMSHVSISRSYAVLVGLEAYVKTRRRGKKLIQKLVHHRDKILSPEEEMKRLEAERDKSESAEKERRFLEQKERGEREDRADRRLLAKLASRPWSPGEREREGVVSTKKEDGVSAQAGLVMKESPPMCKVGKQPDPDVQAPGTGPENAIAPEGTRTLP